MLSRLTPGRSTPMPSPDLIRDVALPGRRLFSVGLVLAVATWGAPRAVAAPGTDDTCGLLDTPLTEVITDGVGDDPTLIDWRVLRGLNYRTGEWNEDLDAVNGTLVKMVGFPVPFEDWASNVTEFLLVPYEGACVHAPAPPPHQVVWVQMSGSRRASLPGMNPVWVEGILHIELGDNVYGQAGFRLVGTKVYPFRY